MTSPWNTDVTALSPFAVEPELWSQFGESVATPPESPGGFEGYDSFAGFEAAFGAAVPVGARHEVLPVAHESPEQATVRQAVAAGNTDPNKLTNLVFLARHPERNGAPLTAAEPGFARLGAEWTTIRDSIVRPVLTGGSGGTTATDLWVPGAERVKNGKSAGGSYIGAPWRFVFHTIEGEPSAQGFRTLAAEHANPPHLWAAPHLNLLLQTIPLDRSAYALARPGSIQTNRANAIQLELWGHAARMGEASPETLAWLAERVLAPVAMLVPINLERVTEVAPGESCYGAQSSCRMSAAEWAAFDGVTGHHRVPDNKHWDPGLLNLPAIAARARITVGKRSYVQREQLGDHDGPGFEAETDSEGPRFEQQWPPPVGELWTPISDSSSAEGRSCCGSCAGTQGEAGAYSSTADEGAVLRAAIAGGQRDPIQLTNLVFFRRHPERGQRLISRDEPGYVQLSQEWLSIRDTIVLPALGAGAPSSPSAPGGSWPAPGGRPPAPGGPPTAPGGPPTGGGTPSGGGGAAPWGGHQNGRIPASALCPITSAPQWMLECNAAKAFGQMNAAYRAQTGSNISINDAYRSYDRQVEMKAKYGNMAAQPGTSNHGWGKAVDLGNTNLGTGPFFDWLNANAGRFGWVHPAWAKPNGSKPESHHWEFGYIS